MTRWLELAEKKENEIKEALENAFRASVDDRHLEFVIELKENGRVYTWYCPAGSNSFTADVHDGKAVEIKHFCHQYMDIEITEDDIREHMSEGQIETAEKAINDEDEWCDNFEEYVREHYRDVIQETENDWLDWYKNEYAYQAAVDAYDNFIMYSC